MIRFQAERGEYGPLNADEIENKVQEIAAIIRNPLGGRYERRTTSGRYIEFSYSPLSDGSVLGVYRDITELKDREQALARAKEDIERTRAVMQTILDNMNDGVILLDADFNFVFGNEQFMDKLKVPPDVAVAGKSVEDIIRYQAARGDFGPTDDVERTVKERRAMMLTPGGVRYERKTVSGRHLEFNYQPLADGGLLGVHRDITEIKEREAGGRAGAQHHAVRAGQHERRRDAVRFRLSLEIHQPAADRFPQAAARSGRAGHCRCWTSCASRPGAAISARSRRPRSSRSARFEFIAKPGGCYFERRTADGRHLEFRFIPLRERRHHRGHARHHRAEGPRAGARHLQGGRRDRARRGRAHAPDHADRVRQPGRRRLAVRQGFPLGVQQSSPPRAAWLHAGQDSAGRFRP